MFDKTFDDFANFGYTALNCPQCGCSFEEKISSQCDLHEILVENECVCKENMVKSRRICVCDDGYILENDKCIDIDECLLDICSKAWCENFIFRSLIIRNYSIIFDHLKNAHCENADGSYSCTCLAGFEGDGRTCFDIDECQVKNDCDENSDCINRIVIENFVMTSKIRFRKLL